MPDFHIGGEPDRQGVIAGPLEGLALGDEGVVVAFRPTYRLRLRLRVRLRARQTQRNDAGASGEAEAVREERPSVPVDLWHGDALPAQSFWRMRFYAIHFAPFGSVDSIATRPNFICLSAASASRAPNLDQNPLTIDPAEDPPKGDLAKWTQSFTR